MEKNSLDVLAINESKIDESISDNEVKISGYVACRKDRNRYGGVYCCMSETVSHFECAMNLFPNSLRWCVFKYIDNMVNPF